MAGKKSNGMWGIFRFQDNVRFEIKYFGFVVGGGGGAGKFLFIMEI